MKRIFIGYANEIGRIDIESLEEIAKDYDQIYIIISKELNEKVKTILENSDILKGKYQLIVTKSIRKTIKEIKKKNKEEKIEISHFSDFGKRAMSRDPC